MSFVIANVKFSSALWHQIHVIMLAAAAALVFFLLVEVGSAAVRSLVRRARRPAPAASVAKAELYAVAAEPAPAMPAPDDDGEHDDFSWEPVVIPMPATTAAPAVNSLAPPVQSAEKDDVFSWLNSCGVNMPESTQVQRYGSIAAA